MAIKNAKFLLLAILFGACANNTSEPKDLDPSLVAIAGVDYHDILVEEIVDISDTLNSLLFESKHFEFNLIPSQKTLSKSFQVNNVGSKASYISHFESLCNCIDAEVEKEIIEAGEAAMVNVTFDPRLWDAGESRSLLVYTKHFPHKHKLKIKRNK